MTDPLPRTPAPTPAPETPPEVWREKFVTHIGMVRVNNFRCVKIQANVQVPVGHVVRESDYAITGIVCHTDTIREIARAVREAMKEMKQEGLYVRR